MTASVDRMREAEERSDSNAENVERMRRDAKRERFLRVATRRLERAVAALKGLRRCASRAGYDYGPADVDFLRDTLEGEVEAVLEAFAPPAKPVQARLVFPSAAQEPAA